MGSAVQKAGTILFLGIGAAFAIWAWDRDIASRKLETETARKAGFDSFPEMKRAAAGGIADGAAWRAKLKADDDEAKRQREADAPRRAAEAADRLKREQAEWEERQPPAYRIKIANWSWEKGGFDSVGLMTLTIRNDNPYDVKDFLLICSFKAASGTPRGERPHVLYESIKAQSSRTFAKVNIGFIPSQSARAECRIDAASRK